MKTTSMMIVGVGGQGTLLASRILGSLFMDMGLDVKVSEVHGMSQRGGSVVTYVRWGEDVYSPLVDKGDADYMLAFELLEAARYMDYLKPGGKLVANKQKIDPMSVIIGEAGYPEDIEEKLKNGGADVVLADGLKMAMEAGSAKAVNVALLGTLAKVMDVPKEKWLSAIEKNLPAKFRELNLKAFELGYAG